MKTIQQWLAEGTLLFDGGMGTFYRAKPGVECEQANLTDPQGILAVHREYLSAGANALKTNTFGVGRMAAAGEAGWQELAAAGYRLACEAAGEDALVFADLGPLPAQTERPAEVYGRVVDCFAALGAENYLFETLSSTDGVLEAAAALKAGCPAAFVVVSFAVQGDGYTRDGGYYKNLLRHAADSGVVDAVGLNCVSGPKAMAALLADLPPLGVPLSAMPNAGYPVVLRSRVSYQGRPDYFAAECGRMAAAGVRILGGCCGTTPAHIAALAAEKQLKRCTAAPIKPAVGDAAPKTPAAEDPFLRRLAEGKPVIAVELDSPKVADLTDYMESARRLQAAGVDAMTIADCPIAHARMDSSLVACRVRRELGLTALPHMTCRDRNLNASKALLLGLYAEGVREVLAITGDPIPTAERDEVKSVYQFNSRKFAQYIRSLAGEGREMPGEMAVFGALNLNAPNFAVELRRAEEKLENGMMGFLTQPVLSVTALENLALAHRIFAGRAKILAGIIPVVSQRNAIFMENEVNGIHVDSEIIAMYEGKNREEGEALALTLSVKIAKEARPYADGFYLMTPFNRVGLMERLVAALRTEVLAE